MQFWYFEDETTWLIIAQLRDKRRRSKRRFFSFRAIKTLPRYIRVTLPRKKRSGPSDQNFKREGQVLCVEIKPPCCERVSSRSGNLNLLRGEHVPLLSAIKIVERARNEERACCGFNWVYVISRFRFPAECRHEIRVAHRVRGTLKTLKRSELNEGRKVFNGVPKVF